MSNSLTKGADSNETMPKEWPGAFGIYKYSKAAVKPYVWWIVGAYITSFVITTVVQALVHNNIWVTEAVNFAVTSAIVAFITIVWLAGIRQQTVSFKAVMERVWRAWLPLLGLLILIYLVLLGSLLLFIVPFFFVLPRVSLAMFYLIDSKDLDVMAAYKASWHRTKGHVGKVWGIIGVTLLMSLLFVTIVGIPFAIYLLLMYSAATAVLYVFLEK